jgi:hypothetical protein
MRSYTHCTNSSSRTSGSIILTAVMNIPLLLVNSSNYRLVDNSQSIWQVTAPRVACHMAVNSARSGPMVVHILKTWIYPHA